MNAPIRTPLGLLVPLLTLLLSAAAASFARAQTVFFDDFSGPELHPRWTHRNGPNGVDWTYDFENSMFNLRSVRATMPGKIPWRGVDFHTSVDLPGDFTVTARVGWTAGGPARQIGIRLTSNNPAGGNFTYPLYMDEWLTGTPRFYWELLAGRAGSSPAPHGAFVEFTIARAGATIRAFIDGLEVDRVGGRTERVHSLSVIMLGDSRSMQPLHVDSVSVVPAPGTAAGIFMVVWLALARPRTVRHLSRSRQPSRHHSTVRAAECRTIMG